MKFLRSMLRNLAILFYRFMCIVLPVKKNRIVFDSSIGKSYSGNPRYIFEYMIENAYQEKWELTWFYENDPFLMPGDGYQYHYGRFRYLYYMATAKVWIFDGRQPEFLIKRDNCFYIQTWHGTPLKKLGLDMSDVFMYGENDIKAYQDSFVKNVKTWDYLISQNPFSTETFRRAFAFDKEMLEIGYPRNDMLFSKNNEEDINILKNRLGLPFDKKIILYAPTFRDDEFSTNSAYKFNPSLDFDKFKEAVSDEYVLIIKYHYLIMDYIDWFPYRGFIYNFDQSHDIAELFLVSDILITDYSSVMFDFSILRRPMFFYAYDLDKYKNNLRGFYFDYEENMPGPISTDTEGLIKDIREYDMGKYTEKYDRFCEKFNTFDDGNASKKITELVERLMKEN